MSLALQLGQRQRGQESGMAARPGNHPVQISCRIASRVARMLYLYVFEERGERKMHNEFTARRQVVYCLLPGGARGERSGEDQAPWPYRRPATAIMMVDCTPSACGR